MIAIVDYGAGNLRSIKRALETVGANAAITTVPATIAAADAIVFPGVGHAGAAMDRLHALGLPSVLYDVVADGKPFLGICLGMQLLFAHQDEGDVEGLGVLPGRVRRLSGPIKVPHMGWNRSRIVRDGPLGGAGAEHYYYFVHSYAVEPADAGDIAAEASYGGSFPSVIIHDNIWGTQFHPEKSGEAGIAVLRAFVEGLPGSSGGDLASTVTRSPAPPGAKDAGLSDISPLKRASVGANYGRDENLARFERAYLDEPGVFSAGRSGHDRSILAERRRTSAQILRIIAGDGAAG